MADVAAVAREIVLPAPASTGHVAGTSVGGERLYALEAPDEVLFSAEAIQQQVRALAATLSADYADLRPILVGILRGSVAFMADLIRAISVPIEVDWLAISSYTGQSSSGVVRLLKDLDSDITERHLILIEDIVDTGLTINYVMRLLEARQPASLKLCALLNKPARRIADRPIDYVGFDVPDVFVVGYGLDYEQRYRNLPYVAALDPARLPS
ncbi:MAG: hypoxanthine phosphoribosyltransferase [Dehalococcoidia bacterium]|nr:hypoxanthine phosphoribosyltransferase [Dehalococcoidia bacterium]